jgi:hypothetical protein
MILTFYLSSILETVNEENYWTPVGMRSSERDKISARQWIFVLERLKEESHQKQELRAS